MRRATARALSHLLAACIGATGAASADPHPGVFQGPYFGEVVRVVDGDNFEARIAVWPTITATVSVRIRGIDAPELFRPECPQERLGAIEAKSALEDVLPLGTSTRIEQVEADSFSGRVLAVAYRQSNERGRTLVELLTNRDVVRVWEPGMPEIDWCSEVLR